MSAPFVGPPTAPGATGCAYSPDIDRPPCINPATAHVVGEAPAWGTVCLPTCDAHRGLARAALTAVANIHPVQGCTTCEVTP